jgi:uncharacterized protein YceH (UPF0502 family)
MDLHLEPAEARVIGSLIEKEITTPEYYPLSLNALVNACNQKSNREPVVAYDDVLVDGVLESLRHKGLLIIATGAGSRVPKYGHRFTDRLNLGRREIAILCELMVRGPQTSGELRGRTERMHRFDDVAEIESVLERMPELVVKMPRRPGEKEGRYSHLLCGPPSLEVMEESAPAMRQDRVTSLESEVTQLRQEVESLKAAFAEFRKQFE